jgi:hypothetical protein
MARTFACSEEFANEPAVSLRTTLVLKETRT